MRTNLFTKFFRLFYKPVNVPETPPPPVPKGEKENSSEDKGTYLTQYAFTLKWQVMEERMNTTNLLLMGAFIVLVACFISLYFNYMQFIATSKDDYSQQIKALNDQKFQLQQSEIDFLMKVATQSAK